jgi:O-antigen ligase
VLFALALVGILGGNGALGLALAPIAVFLAVAAAWRLPLRDSLLGVAFLAFTLENPAEAFGAGVWRSPLHVVGALFLQHMNVVLPVRALIFSGLDVALALLVVAHVYRRRTGIERPHPDFVPAAPPIRTAALVALAAMLCVWAFGLARGGSFGNSLWQIFRVVYLPGVVLLFLVGIRGPRDAGRLGAVLLAAALVRAAVAIYVRSLFPDKEAVPFTTIHADSMLFTDAVVLVVALLLERPDRRTWRLALVALPVLLWAMVANNRRLVWVELLLALAAVAIFSRWTPVKRRLAQLAVAAVPVLLLYVAVGWTMPQGVFAPVATLRSVVDSGSNTSTAWRDWENYNIARTLARSPVLGTGFGHEYDEVVILPSISSEYSLYRYAPHNSILGLVAFAGILGFAGIWMLVPVGMLLAIRAHRWATEPRDRVAALTAMGVLVSYAVHCYGDMGLGTWVSVFTVAPAVVLVAKIAVANGAWPSTKASSSAPRPPHQLGERQGEAGG